MTSLPILIIGGLVIAGLVYAARPPVAFVVRVTCGEPAALRGKVAGPFLVAVGEVCRQHGITTGTVRGLAVGRRITLRFSREFPEGGRQQLRNWWAQSGWPAPRS